MLPLTQSLYVPGRVAGGGAVLVDIGTGYYAEKSVPSAQDMIERKARRDASSALSLSVPRGLSTRVRARPAPAGQTRERERVRDGEGPQAEGAELGGDHGRDAAEDIHDRAEASGDARVDRVMKDE